MQSVIRPRVLLFALAVITLWSAFEPANQRVWFFEALPALGLMGGLVWSFRQWPLTTLSNSLIALGATLMLIGAHYTYARMPLFSLLRDSLALSRNHFDRFGHLFQGVVPAIVLREVLIRRRLVSSGVYLSVLVVGFCLALAVTWEIVEWIAVVIAGGTPEIYQGFQGDAWDSERDVVCALIGAVAGLALLGRMHDRQLTSVRARD
jgi:putative membrane protein